MTVSGISSQTQALLSQLTGQASGGKTAAQTTTAANRNGGDPAYQLSLGQEQIDQGILGYGQLGKLVRQTDSKIADTVRQDLNLYSVTDGEGKLPTRTFTVNVTQLAIGQKLTSEGVADVNKTSLGTGKLTLTATDGTTFDIDIKDGTLGGIAKSVNAARVGISARVILGTDGQYRLELTGPTGAENSFKLSGIDKLAFDPQAAAPGSMTLAQKAQDAIYAIDGGDVETSPDNKVLAKDGSPILLNATGQSSVKVPFGLNRISEAADTLASALNNLLSNIDELTAGQGMLAGAGDTAKGLKASVIATLQQNFAGGSLADAGIVAKADGSIAVDTAKLQSAYSDKPTSVRDLLADFASAVHDALMTSGEGSIDQQVESFTGQLTKKLSLMDYLNFDGGQSNSSQFDGVLGMPGGEAGSGSGSDFSSSLLANFKANLPKT